MTIEDIYRKGEISILARNICMANEIETLEDLKQHHVKGEGFRNLRYCDEKSNDELIAVYNKYSNIYTEGKTSHRVSKLEDIVTDFDEVNKTMLTVNAYLKEKEKELQVYWNEKREKETSQNKNRVSSLKAASVVANVIDLDETKQAIEDYRRKQVSEETTESIGTTNLELKQKPKRHWREKVIEITEKKVVKNKSTFGRHPSQMLNALYAIKSYQGANPEDAKVIFVGRDPNWAADIEERKMFEHVVSYLSDGIDFWETNGIHHPFLLRGYKGDGRKYHRSFSKMKFDSSVANKISFVELIGFPTTGMAGSNSTLFKEYLFSEANSGHLIELDKLLSNNDKIIFIAWGLINDFKLINKRTGLFEMLAKLDKSKMDITDLNQYENIFVHRHFSDAISSATIAKMEKEVKKHL